MTTSRFSNQRLRAVGAFTALGLLLAACGDSETDATDSTTEQGAATTSSSSVPEPESTTTTSEPPTTAVANDPVPDDELPGEPFDFAPAGGSELAVVGVAADDVLNLRALPDPSAEILGTLDPLGIAEITDRKRIIGDAIWVEVVLDDGGAAWANLNFLKPLAGVRDVTGDITDLLGGSLPTAASADELVEAFEAQILAASTEDGGEGPGPTATVVAANDDGSTATIDVTGYLDDSVLGDRLTIAITDDGGSFSITAIESAPICQRGVDGGFCL